MSLRLLRVLNGVAFTWATLMTLLWATVPKYSCGNGRERMWITGVKSDLRNVAIAQEEYHAAHGRYATSIAELRAGAQLHSLTMVHTTIDGVSAETWSASGTSEQLPRWRCTIDGKLQEPICHKQKTWAERNIPKPTPETILIEYWLIVLSLRRRYRRATASATA